MKLTVIGCSPAWPNAGGAQSGYLVEGDGPPAARLRAGRARAPAQLDGGWPRVDAVAITHFHLDHWGDLVPWIFGASFGPGRDVPKPELWLPPGGRARLASYGGEMGFEEQIDGAFDVREYEDGTSFQAAGFDVTPLRLDHYSEKTFGLRVSNHRSTLAYSGDTGPSPNLAEIARDADVFLCEATLREPEPAERGHLTEGEASSAYIDSGARRLVVIHRPDELPLGATIERARDGDVFEF